MYQVVGRHFEPFRAGPPAKPVLEVVMGYDRTSLSTKDVLRAKATVKYNGKVPTYLVIVDLPVPPGLTVDAGELAELVGAKRIQKFSVTARQVTLYLGDVRPGPATWAAARYPSSWRRSPRCSRRAVWYVCPCARTVGACAAR